MAYTYLTLQFVIAICVCCSNATDYRVINGEVAENGKFPYMAAIVYQTGTTTRRCGGTVISERCILTAAHCLQASSYLVYLGTNNLETPGNNVVILNTSTTVINPSYQSLSLANNLGILVLNENIVFNENIKAVQFPTTALNDGTSVVFAGWGITGDGQQLAPALRFVSLSTISNSDCRSYYSSYVTSTTVCATGTGNAGTCTGDSGGPLIEEIGGNAVQVAVGSFHSASGCENSNPSGYTRTYPFVDWINEVIAEHKANGQDTAFLLLPLLVGSLLSLLLTQ